MKTPFQYMENTILAAPDPKKAAQETADLLALLFKIAARVDAKRAGVHTIQQETDARNQTLTASDTRTV